MQLMESKRYELLMKYNEVLIQFTQVQRLFGGSSCSSSVCPLTDYTSQSHALKRLQSTTEIKKKNFFSNLIFLITMQRGRVNVIKRRTKLQ